MAKTASNLWGGDVQKGISGNRNSGGAVNRFWGWATGKDPENPLEEMYPVIADQANQGFAAIPGMKQSALKTQQDTLARIREAAGGNQQRYQDMVTQAQGTEGRAGLESSLTNAQDLVAHAGEGVGSVPDDEALFQLMARRQRESLGTQLAGSGLGTSGRGLDIQNKANADLATQFGEKQFDRHIARQTLIDTEKFTAQTLLAGAAGDLSKFEQGRSSLIVQAQAAAAAGNTADAKLYSDAAIGLEQLQAMPEALRAQLIAAISGTVSGAQQPGTPGAVAGILGGVGAAYAGKGK